MAGIPFALKLFIMFMLLNESQWQAYVRLAVAYIWDRHSDIFG